jgi:hypothetical protein
MISLIFMILVSVGSFIAGTYYEKSNSIRKTKPLKRALSNINEDRTFTMERNKK